MSVAKRVEDLERIRSSSSEKRVVLVVFGSPTAPAADGKFPISGYRTLHGEQSWQVLPGETAEECKRRAEHEVQPNEWNIAVLLEEQRAEIAT